jgi:hypothetical protein
MSKQRAAHADGDDADDLGPLVPDPKVAEELCTSLMGLWRWDRDPVMIELGWPPKIKRGGRNFRFRKPLDKFKQALLRQALTQRQQLLVTTR